MAGLLDTVREADRDRYLAALYAPEDKREALLALYAFNAEIASVRDRIREPLPGEIRLQWWRDLIDGGDAEQASGSPLAEALLATIRDHRLPRIAFDNYIEARLFDLYDDPMPGRTELEGYCGETASALLQLSALVLDPGEAAGCAELAGHAGCAQAITGLMRLLPLHVSRGQCYIPADILAAVGSSAEGFLQEPEAQSSRMALAAMRSLAHEHLSAFEREARRMPQTLRPAFLPLALTGAYLDRLDRANGIAPAARTELSALRKHVRMFRRAWRGW